MHQRMRKNIVTLESCSVALGGRAVLHGIGFNLAPGQRWAVLGGNGSGKTTFLRLIRGEVHPMQGMGGKRAYDLDDPGGHSPLAAKRNMSLVSAEAQDAWTRLGLAVNGMQVVLSGFADSLYPPSRILDAQKKRAQETLEMLGASRLAGKQLSIMSRGEARLVLLARALATNPQVLLLDEFIDGLDESAASAVLSRLEDLTQNGLAMVLTTHRPARLPGFIDKALLMRDGRIVKTGAPDAIAAAITEVPAFDHVKNTSTNNHAPEFLVRLQDASVRRQGRDVLKDVSLTIHPGEHLAVLGPNGAGKSTLLMLFMAWLRPMPGGEIQWFGQDGPVDVFEIRKKIGYVSPEMQAGYAYDVSALELVLSGFDASIGLYREPSAKETARARELISLAGLEGLEDHRIRRLSYGQLRRLLVARALAPNPGMLLLDEAASGLDPAARTGLMNVLEHAAATGTSLVMTTHHKDELPACINRVLTIQDGRVLARKVDAA
jgi:molybdate transport system ATP-binding protein